MRSDSLIQELTASIYQFSGFFKKEWLDGSKKTAFLQPSPRGNIYLI
jgi:hypothetical protein